MFKSFLLAIIFGIFLKTGIIVHSNGNHAYSVQCKDTMPCYFDLELVKGNYLYVSKDSAEQITLIVTDTGVYELGAQKTRIIN